jgi:hypothetical protein
VDKVHQNIKRRGTKHHCRRCNRALKREAVFVSPEYNTVARPKLFVNTREVNKTEQVVERVAAATTASVETQRFESKKKTVHFYYIPKLEGEIPDVPTDTKSWQNFFDNNKIASRSNRTATKKRGRQEAEQEQEQQEEQQQEELDSQPLQNTTTPRVISRTAAGTVVTDNRQERAVNIRDIAAGILSPPPAAAATTATTATPATKRPMGDIIGSFWNDKQIASWLQNGNATDCNMEEIIRRRIELLGKAAH